MAPRVLGIDPGLNTTGYGVLEAVSGGPRLCEAGIIRGTDRRSLSSRLAEIYQGVADVIAQWSPEAVAIEQLYSHYERPRTAILMGHARGVIVLAASQAQLAVSHYAATRVKKLLTGHGRASKVQVQAAIQREFRLATPPEPFDVCDALAVALCHFYARRDWVAQARGSFTSRGGPSPKASS